MNHAKFKSNDGMFIINFKLNILVSFVKSFIFCCKQTNYSGMLDAIVKKFDIYFRKNL